MWRVWSGRVLKKMATSTTPALTIDWSFAAKVIALRFLQVGALVAVIIACIVYIVKVLKVRTGPRTHSIASVLARAFSTG